jgi:hypothetical protein
MKCRNCGKENRPGVNFCEQCGQTLGGDSSRQEPKPPASGHVCSACGNINRQGVDFCEECGQSLLGVASQQTTNKSASAVGCPVCGSCNREGVQFCEQCGASLSRMQPVIPLRASTQVCPVCGYANRSDVRFCENCGNDLSAMLEHVPVMAGKKVSSWKWIALPLVGIVVLFLLVGALFIYRQTWPYLQGINGFSPPANPVANQPQLPAPAQGGSVGITPEQNVSPEQSSGQAVSAGITPGQKAPPDTSSGSGCTNHAELVSVVNATVLPPDVGFAAEWLVKNVGTCTWTTAYSIVYSGGEQMGAASMKNLPGEIPPNQSSLISVDMVSPSVNGSYQGEWILQNASGDSFGLGADGSTAFQVSIDVSDGVVVAGDPGAISPGSQTEQPAVGGGPGSNVDTDDDGLDDATEDWLANAFVPYVEYAGHDDVNKKISEIIRFYQVTPIYKTFPELLYKYNYIFPGYSGPPGVLITYVYAYKQDTGTSIFEIEGHNGDLEYIRILLVHPRDVPWAWVPAVIVVNKHGNDPDFLWNGQKIRGEDNFDIPQTWYGTHIKLWASAHKHAFYAYHYDCENYKPKEDPTGLVKFEDCGGGYILDTPITPGEDGFNVGERLNPAFVRIPNNPRGLYTSEYAWSGSESMVPVYDASNNMQVVGTFDASGSFCGGLGGSPCATGMNAKWWPVPDVNKQRYLQSFLGFAANTFYAQNFGEQYEICFITHSTSMAGTDFWVNLTLLGNKSELSEQKFINVTSGAKNLGSSNWDCFYAGSYNMGDPVGGINLLVYNDNSSDSEWNLADVAIRDLYASDPAMVFHCDCWIDNNSAYDPDIGLNTIGPYIHIPIFH